MLSTKAIVSSIESIPREWVFEFYLKLEEKLTGQDVRIKSIFNPADTDPSFYIYYSRKSSRYMFKDFSGGVSGDGVELVQKMLGLTTRGEAAHKIIEDYNHFLLTNKEDYSLRQFKIRQKYRVERFDERSWTTSDARYWMRFHIGSKMLQKYNVIPLSEYKMTKEEEGETKELIIKGPRIYGYFRKDGTLYKIYQPMLRENKFIKIKDYIQGTDQLTVKVPFLVICSSLKDIMGFNQLRYRNAEAIAPDSENNLIPERVITAYRQKYESIVTLFDIDDAGIRAMENYQNKFGIPGIKLKMEKDLSDSMALHGIAKVREVLSPLLTKALRGKKEEECLVSA